MADEAAEKPEIVQPSILKTRRKRISIRPFDIIILGIVVVAIVVMSVFIINRLRLKQEVSAAKTVGNKVVSALSTQNTAALRTLGDSSFQAKNSAAVLDKDLTADNQTGNPIKFSQLYGKTKPSLDRQIVANNARGQHVVFVYRYDTLKVPLFVRVDTAKNPGSSRWYLQALTVGTDETALTTVGY